MLSNLAKYPAFFGAIFVWGFIWSWMRLIRWFIPVDVTPNDILRPYMGVTPETNPWLEIWQRWDVLHYQAIAERGYLAFDTALFTPPLYPFLMKIFGVFFDNNTLLSGLFISGLCFIASVISIEKLAQYEFGDEAFSQRTMIYLLLFPTSFFLFAPYTESLFLLGSILCLLALRKKNWGMAGLWGMLAAASRLTGALIFFPVVWCVWQDWKENRNWQVWFAPFLVFCVSISFSLYAWLGLGQSFFSPFQAQSQRFHGGFSVPAVNIIKALQQVFTGNYPLTNLFDVIFIVVFFWLGILVWKQLPKVYAIYYWSFMILYLTRIADVYPLLSMTRYVLILFPAFLILARYGENSTTHRVIIYLFMLGLLFFSAQFSLWGWVG
ncbi:MAG TPA: hypothetical protein DIW23_09735 [Anaerolineae bacterium]|nr:hypothetical protein [Anaerolineae bacterium]